MKTTPMNTTIDNNWKTLSMQIQIINKSSKVVSVKGINIDNNISLHIYHSINKLSKPR